MGYFERRPAKIALTALLKLKQILSWTLW